MLLRRFMKHVTDQNWLAVGIDLLVVIGGIFLGMQVTEWNDERKDRVLERAYLERLSDDLTHNIDVLQALTNFHTSTRRHMNDTAELLMAERWDEDEHQRLIQQGFAWSAYPSAQLRMGTWEELVSTGRLSIIKDQELLTLLQQNDAVLDWANGQIDYIRSTAIGWFDDFREITVLKKLDDGEYVIRANFQDVHNNENFVTKLLWATSRHARTIGIRGEQMVTSQAANARIQCLLGTATCESAQ